MLIKLIRAYGTWTRGEVHDVADAVAEQLILAGRAVEHKQMVDVPNKAIQSPTYSTRRNRGK